MVFSIGSCFAFSQTIETAAASYCICFVLVHPHYPLIQGVVLFWLQVLSYECKGLLHRLPYRFRGNFSLVSRIQGTESKSPLPSRNIPNLLCHRSLFISVSVIEA